MKMKLWALLLGIGLTGYAEAQNVVINGKVANIYGGPIYPAQIELWQHGKLIMRNETDSTGKFKFIVMTSQIYTISSQCTGYYPYQNELQTKDKDTLLQITMQAKMDTLANVTVKNTPFLSTTKNGKMIINPAAFTGAEGQQVLNILSRMPGIGVGLGGNSIQIKGKDRITLMINGRMVPLESEEVVAYLNSLNTYTIQTIEIQTNPGSQADANGNAGIINIIFKNGKSGLSEFGVAGTLSYGRILKSTNSLNYTGYKGKMTFSINTDFNFQPSVFTAHFNRILNENTPRFLEQKMQFRQFNRTLPFIFHAHQKLTKKTDFSFYTSTNLQENDIKDKNSTNYRINSPEYDSGYHFNNKSHFSNKRIITNASISHQLDSSGGTLNISTNILYVNNAEKHEYPGYFYKKGGYLKVLNYKAGNRFEGFAAAQQVDLTKLIHKTNAKFGAKISIASFTAHPFFTDLSQSVPFNPPENNISFQFSEQIYAFYGVFQKQHQKWYFEAGLRLELMDMESENLQEQKKIRNKDIDLFPSVTISHTSSQKNVTTLQMSRRVDRPGYNNLNPNLRFRTPLLFARGNASLIPQYTSTIELSKQHKRFTFNAGYSHISQKWQVVQTQTPPGDAAVINTINTNHLKNFYFIISYQKNWFNTLNINFNSTIAYTKTKFLFNDTTYQNSLNTIKLNTTLTYLAKKKLKAELLFQYEGPFIDGIFTYKPRWQINPIIRYEIHSTTSCNIGITDIFHTYYPRFSANFNGITTSNRVNAETTSINLTISHRIAGKKWLKKPSRNQDEQFGRF